MCLTECDQTFIIFINIHYVTFIIPLNAVRCIRGRIAVLIKSSLRLLIWLRSKHLFTSLHKWYTLRSKKNRASQLIHLHSVSLTVICIGNGKLIPECQIIMTGYIINTLSRLSRPVRTLITSLCERNLRMRGRCYNTEFNVFFHIIFAAYKTFVQKIKYTAFDPITDIITESTHTIQPVNIVLRCQLCCRQCRFSSSPSFTIYHNVRIHLIQCFSDSLHGIQIMYAHQVKPETIYMIFRCPVYNRIYDILAHHGTLRGCFITTA